MQNYTAITFKFNIAAIFNATHSHACCRGRGGGGGYKEKVDEKRRTGRPKPQWRDTINADMKMWGSKANDTEDRDRWRSLIESSAKQKQTHKD